MQLPPSRRRRVSWSDLHPKALRKIASFLPNNLLQFRSVCKKWCRSTSFSTLLPLVVEDEFDDCVVFSSSVILLRRHGSSSSSPSPPWMVSIVEMTKGKVQLFHPFGDAHKNVPVNVDLDHFRSTCLTVGYHRALPSDNISSSSTLGGFPKTVLSSKRPLPCIDDVTLLMIYKGELEVYQEYEWLVMTYDSVDEFDDVVSFKGMLFTLNRQGKIYQVSPSEDKLHEIPFDRPVSKDDSEKRWRKRLVASLLRGKLYMIAREKERLKVYEFFKCDKSWVSNEAQGFGEDDQVLFVTREYCFFAAAREFPGCELTNCIIFSNRAFLPCSDCSLDGNQDDIQIFRLGGGYSDTFQPISSYPGFPTELWSPPSWVFQAHMLSPSQLQYRIKSEFMEDEDIQPVASCSRDDMCLQEQTQQVLTPSSQLEPERLATEVPSSSEVAAFDHETLREKTINSISRAYITSYLSQTNNHENTIKFEGFEIRSNLVPMLQKIWSKHGNIIENSILSNGDILARVLESLAITLLILESNTAKSLTDCQANYLKSTLSDLRRMCFKVEWLVPFVEKALRLHECKPLMDSLNNLKQLKSKAVEQRSKLLDELAKLDEVVKELDEDIGKVSNVVTFSKELDYDQPLGGVLV